jgi:8-oxo-dGTP diphosphatase
MTEQIDPRTVLNTGTDASNLPYRIAVLCYLEDLDGRLLMLHRRKNPNAGMYSPVGGKLEIADGEGPHNCAKREIQEETGLDIDPRDIQLIGMVSETAYEANGHWLIFCFKVIRPIHPDEILLTEIDEGILEWIEPDQINSLNIPETDRKVLWPLVQKRENGIFAVHIDCSTTPMQWTVHEPGTQR